jgi:hypothetical protein
MKKFSMTILLFVAPILFGAIDLNAAPLKSKKTINSQQQAIDFLSKGVWRGEDCNLESNFQKFRFKNVQSQLNSVEVGFGELGSGEPLEIIKYDLKNQIIEVQTRVCAPVGCNQTFEQYKIIGPDKMFEWTFEGHLPDQPPNIVVRNGIDKEGNSGRTFKRCKL